MRTLRMMVVACLATTLGVAACGADSAASGPLAFTKGNKPEPQDGATTTGTLVWDGSCAYMAPENPVAMRSVIVFTEGAATVEDGTIKYGDAVYQDGDAVEWPGILRDSDETPKLTEWAAIPEACTEFDGATLVYPAG